MEQANIVGTVCTLLSEDQFRISPDAAKEEATVEFARALVALGWGPEMNRREIVIERPTKRYSRH